MFITGQKVVCIDDTFSPQIASLYDALPVKDSVYVVRGSTVGVHHDGKGARDEGVITVYLIGIVNPRAASGAERGFLSDRFRPLEEMTEEQIKTENLPETEREKVLVSHEHDDADWWKKAA